MTMCARPLFQSTFTRIVSRSLTFPRLFHTQSSAMAKYTDKKWWKEAVVYQIYPSSFQAHPGAKNDQNVGWGTVKGITSRVDYLKSLGVDVVWTSPIYKSPQADMGE